MEVPGAGTLGSGTGWVSLTREADLGERRAARADQQSCFRKSLNLGALRR